MSSTNVGLRPTVVELRDWTVAILVDAEVIISEGGQLKECVPKIQSKQDYEIDPCVYTLIDKIRAQPDNICHNFLDPATIWTRKQERNTKG